MLLQPVVDLTPHHLDSSPPRRAGRRQRAGPDVNQTYPAVRVQVEKLVHPDSALLLVCLLSLYSSQTLL